MLKYQRESCVASSCDLDLGAHVHSRTFRRFSQRLGVTLRVGASLGMGCVFAAASSAHAQEQADTNASSSVLEQILVTATKRGDAQDVQEVPLAVTAFGAQQLQELNFHNLQSLTYSIPNVQFETIGAVAGYQNFSIRGLGINSSIPTIDPTVGVFVDGVYMGSGNGVLFDNFDLEGIEVLRGPQGLLFGRNVTGGAVLVRTRTPSYDPYFSARVGGETGPNYIADVSVSGPLVDQKLAGKIAAYYNRDDGWFDNLFNGQKQGAAEQWIVRPALRWDATDSINFVLRLEHGERTGDGAAAQNHALYSRDSFNFAINEPGNTDDEWSQAFLETHWNVAFGDGTITNILGWREYNGKTLFDVDGTPNLALHSRFLNDQEQFSEELRYAGNFGPVVFTTGVYYFTQDLLFIENRRLAGGATNVTGGGTQDSRTYGVFASADWQVTDRFTVNVGARYSYEEKDAKVATFRPTGTGACNIDAEICVFDLSSTSNFADKADWDDVSPRVGFQWKPGDHSQVYAFWAKGFRSGGYNVRRTADATSPGPYDAEEQTTVELGLKHDFAGSRARVNLAVFDNTIDGILREINLPGPLGVAQNITNVGKLQIRGVEVEGQTFVTDAWMVSVQAGYLDGEYKSLQFDLNNDGTINAADYALQPPRLSPWTYGASTSYEFVFESTAKLTSRISFNHRDKNFYTDNNLGRLNAVDSVDANLTFQPSRDGRWTFSVYGTNLLNETSFGGDTQLPDAGTAATAPFGGDGPGGLKPPATFSPLNKGRVVGADVRVSF